MQLKPLHVGISVLDMDQALKWYQDVLGFQLLRDDGWVPPLEARACFLEQNGFQVELFQYRNPIPLPEDRLTPNQDLRTVGTKHVAFEVEDMEAMKARLVAAKADIALETQMGREHVLFLRDCCGTLIELIQFDP
jgi:catechol 2,3-dioxygenase-like lactoylglutathione lyase family enzyme